MKLWNYMAIMLGMMIFLYFVGLNPSGTVEQVLNNTGINVTAGYSTIDVANSDWGDKIFNPLTGLIIGLGSAIFIGFFTKSFDWKIVMIPFFTSFIGAFLGFGWSLINLVNTIGEGEVWLVSIIVTVFGTLSAMFVFSIVEWFGGND